MSDEGGAATSNGSAESTAAGKKSGGPSMSVLQSKEKTKIPAFVSQLELLLYKNFLLLINRWHTSLVRLAWPAVLVVVFYGAFYTNALTTLTNNSNNNNNAAAEGTFITGSIPKCTKGETMSSCITLLYDQCGDARINAIMAAFAASNDPPLTIKPAADTMAACGEDDEPDLGYDVVGLPPKYTMAKYVSQFPNTTQLGVSWNALTASNGAFSWANHTQIPDFILFHPSTVVDPFLFGAEVMVIDVQSDALLGIEKALIGWASAAGKTTTTTTTTAVAAANISVIRKQAKSNLASDTNIDGSSTSSKKSIARIIGTLFFPVVFFLVCFGDSFTISSTLSSERTFQIIGGLKMMGMTNGPYWLSWLITQLLWGALFSGTVTATGVICGIEFFKSTTVVFCLFFLWLCYITVSAHAFWICSWFHKNVANMSVMILVLFSSGVFCEICSQFPPGFFGGSSFWDIVWSLFYPLHMGRVLNDVDIRTNNIARNSTQFHPYGFADLSDDPKTTIRWAASYNIWLMVMNTAIALFFTWYMDIVWPGQYGIPQRFFFFLTPRWWFPKKTNTSDDAMVETDSFNAKQIGAVAESLDPDIFRESNTTMQRLQRRDKTLALSILKLSKTFKSSRVTSSQDCRALDSFTASADLGTVFAILGHNGAGKTTAINVLTGLVAPTYGDAFICGQSISSNMASIQSKIGVCPQQDIVWPDLTGTQHLRLFSLLKGIPHAKIATLIKELADIVGLRDALHRKVETYSGGMKRRLSVAIAMIGNPSVIFLDEPTAGLDPTNKKHIWDLIAELKKDRLVVLTSHNMAECEALADKICILALGRLRAVGSREHLKQRYGAGYRVNTLVEPENSELVKQQITSIVPDIKLETDSAGHLVFGTGPIPSTVVMQLLRFFESHDGKLVKEWGFAQTSLEEIFLRVVHGTHGDQTAIKDPTAETHLNVCLEHDPTRPLGFFRVSRMVALAEARQMILQLIEGAPKSYRFLYNGVAVSVQQENSIYAADLAPALILRTVVVDDESSSSSSSLAVVGGGGASSNVIIETLTREKNEALKALEAANQEKQTLRQQLQALQDRVSQLESQQQPQPPQ